MMTAGIHRDGFWWARRVVDTLSLLFAVFFLTGLHLEDICCILHMWGQDDGPLVCFLFICSLILIAVAYGHMLFRCAPLLWYTARYLPLFLSLISVTYTHMALPLLALALIVPWIVKRIACRLSARVTPTLMTFWEVSLLALFVAFLAVSLLADNKDIRLYELRIQRHLKEGDYEGALKVASRELVCSPGMMAWRAYAMAKSGTLGQRLWEYPLSENADDIFIRPASESMYIYPLDSVRAFLGLVVHEEMDTRQLERKVTADSSFVGTPLADYWLCTLLLRKDLPSFVQWLPRCYDLKQTVGHGNLPRYYREALILYTHRYIHPSMVYHSVQMDANYDDYKEMASRYNDRISQRNRLRPHYGNTYWWYYDYSSITTETHKE